MLFNSFNFLVFFLAVFILHWFLASKNVNRQNTLLLVASYFFYASWDYRFLSLLIFSTLVGYYTGKKIFTAGNTKKKRFWLTVSVIINVGLLAVFKYYNFFAAPFAAVFSSFGFDTGSVFQNIILPVGISFYTFHGLSYVLDVYNDRIQPVNDLGQYALFVSFFPLLVSGPIERATHLLPQIRQKRSFDYSKAIDGLRQILWGFFKKVVIADNCSVYCNMIFDHPAGHSGSTLTLGAIFFVIQVYNDFSGYSDIALGIARLLGIELLRNFAFPFFSKSIAEFWRRWHISLSSWFNDYFYTPLSIRVGNWGKYGVIFSCMLSFLVIGLWHGANWTFVVFGGIQGLLITIELLTTRARKKFRKKIPATVNTFLGMLYTFVLFSFSCIFFRSNTIGDAVRFISGIFSASFFSWPQAVPVFTSILIVYSFVIEWIGRHGQYALQFTGIKWPRFFRWSFYYFMIFMVHKYFTIGQSFIYFQF
jgi:alginate O-acetyltransferase complex protein AlgI